MSNSVSREKAFDIQDLNHERLQGQARFLQPDDPRDKKGTVADPDYSITEG